MVDDDGPITVDRLDAIALEPNAGWLPRTRTVASGTSGGAGPIDVRRVEIRRAILDKRPPRTTFRLVFGEERGMYDSTRARTYPPSKTWSLLDLPTDAASGRPEVAPRGWVPTPPVVSNPPVMPPERSGTWPTWALASATIGVLCLALGAIRLYRSRTRGER